MPPRTPRFASLLTAALLVGLGLLACGGSEESREVILDDEEGPIPTPTQAQQALNEALKTFNDHCLAPRAQGRRAAYPLSLFNPGQSSFEYRQLRALTEADLLDTTVTKGERGLPAYRFALTKKGRAEKYDIAKGQGYQSMFCYTVPQVIRVDSIKSVYNAGPTPLANVWFVFNHQKPADWVDLPSVQRSFSGLPPKSSLDDTVHTDQLLMQVDDSTWIDRKLTGYERLPSRSSADSQQPDTSGKS